MHDYPADHQYNTSASGDDKRIGEELRAGVVLDVIPCPLEWGEDVDKKQRIGECKYQKEDDVISRDIIIRYFFLQHLSLKKAGKDSIFSFAPFGSVAFRPYRCVFVPRCVISGTKHQETVTFSFLFAENIVFLPSEKFH